MEVEAVMHDGMQQLLAEETVQQPRKQSVVLSATHVARQQALATLVRVAANNDAEKACERQTISERERQQLEKREAAEQGQAVRAGGRG